MIAKRVTVLGRVQGVWYRAKTKDRAGALGIGGWIRNNPDGSVEAVVEGEDQPVFDLINWMGVGPQLARVDRIDEETIPLNGYDEFTIVR
jgi:acylphosphatase